MECHNDLHEKEEIPVYQDFENGVKLLTHKCARCSGKGYITEYKYYMKGVCFSCDGMGYKIKK